MPRRLRAQTLAQLQAIEARQAQVEQQHIGRRVQRHLQGLAPVRRLFDTVAVALQQCSNLLAQRRMVFHHQHVQAQGRHHSMRIQLGSASSALRASALSGFSASSAVSTSRARFGLPSAACARAMPSLS
jgi:hypothetical protein